MEKILVFDMDGTIADFYNVEGWLEDLRAENARPYLEAKPIYDMTKLNGLLNLMKQDGWRISVLSWMSKGEPSEEFKSAIRTAKRMWLKYYDFPVDEIHIVKYGTHKGSYAKNIRKGRSQDFQVLIDDELRNVNGWHNGRAIEPNENLLMDLMGLYEEFYEGI